MAKENRCFKMNDIDFIKCLSLSNDFECPRCGASTKIPIITPGQTELFAPVCYNCGAEMREKPKI